MLLKFYCEELRRSGGSVEVRYRRNSSVGLRNRGNEVEGGQSSGASAGAVRSQGFVFRFGSSYLVATGRTTVSRVLHVVEDQECRPYSTQNRRYFRH